MAAQLNCVLYSVLVIVYNVQCVMKSVKYIVYMVYSWNVCCTVCKMQCVIFKCT